VTLLLGGELLVAALVYVLVFRDPVRFRSFLWVCAFDQALAVVLPLIVIAGGGAPATWKTLLPLPFQAALAIVYALCTRAGTGTKA